MDCLSPATLTEGKVYGCLLKQAWTFRLHMAVGVTGAEGLDDETIRLIKSKTMWNGKPAHGNPDPLGSNGAAWKPTQFASD